MYSTYVMSQLPLLAALLIQKEKTMKFLIAVAEKEFMVATAICRTFASVCDCTLVLKANVDKGSNRNRSSSSRDRLMASLLVVTPPARKKGRRTAVGRHRHFPLSFVSPAAKLPLATSQPPTVMSIYRARAAAAVALPPEY